MIMRAGSFVGMAVAVCAVGVRVVVVAVVVMVIMIVIVVVMIVVIVIVMVGPVFFQLAGNTRAGRGRVEPDQALRLQKRAAQSGDRFVLGGVARLVLEPQDIHARAANLQLQDGAGDCQVELTHAVLVYGASVRPHGLAYCHSQGGNRQLAGNYRKIRISHDALTPAGIF